MSSIYLFTGENSYEFFKKKRTWMKGFEQKHGNENLSSITAKEATLPLLLDEISSIPFIAEKRLVVVQGIPTFSKEEIGLITKTIHPQVILAFFEQKPDKRLSAVKELLKIAEHTECKPLSEAKLLTWAQSYASELGSSLGASEAQHLLDAVGPDQYLLSTEIAKLAMYCHGSAITSKAIDLMVLCTSERQMWALMDHIGAGDIKSSLRFIEKMRYQGESAQGVWGILLWMCSSLINVCAAVDDGVTNPSQIMKVAGVSFGPAKSFSRLARNTSKQKVHDLVTKIADYDIALKTGGFKTTTDQEQELHVLIDMLIIDCCTLA